MSNLFEQKIVSGDTTVFSKQEATLTNNGVLYVNASGEISTNSNLTFDGVNLSSNTEHHKDVYGANITYINGSSLQIGTSGEYSYVRSSDNSHTISWLGTLTVDITASGAGGLDTGTESADTWYAVHVIDDQSGVNPVAGILSLSSTSPTFPSGYQPFRRLGWVRNNASSNFLKFNQQGNGTQRNYQYDEDYAVTSLLSGGSATTYTTVDGSSLIPPTSRRGIFDLVQTGPVSLHIRSGGSTIDLLTQVLASNDSANVEIQTSAIQTIEYKNSSAGGSATIKVLGYEDSI